jgi:hypothetical protein
MLKRIVVPVDRGGVTGSRMRALQGIELWAAKVRLRPGSLKYTAWLAYHMLLLASILFQYESCVTPIADVPPEPDFDHAKLCDGSVVWCAGAVSVLG